MSVRLVHAPQAALTRRRLGHELSRRGPPVVWRPALAAGDDAVETGYFLLMEVQISLRQRRDQRFDWYLS